MYELSLITEKEDLDKQSSILSFKIFKAQPNLFTRN